MTAVRLACRLLAAFATGNLEAFDNAVDEVEALRAQRALRRRS